MRYFTNIIILFLFLMLAVMSCSRSESDRVMDSAEALMESRPDSSLAILRAMDSASVHSEKERARLGLLMAMARDKSCIDDTTFAILQPAIDYYPDHGNPDDKLRTYYYQGRIYQNRCDYDSAFKYLYKVIDSSMDMQNSITRAMAFAALSCLYYEFHDYEAYTETSLQAANIFKNIHSSEKYFTYLVNALDGAVIKENKNRIDSISLLCQDSISKSGEDAQKLRDCLLSASVSLGSIEDTKRTLVMHLSTPGVTANGCLDRAKAYIKLGESAKAGEILNSIDSSIGEYDLLKYKAVHEYYLENIGASDEAALEYRSFYDEYYKTDTLGSEDYSRVIESKYKDGPITNEFLGSKLWRRCFGIGFLCLICCSVWLYCKAARLKSQKKLAKNKEDKALEECHELKETNIRLAEKITELETEKAKMSELLSENPNLPAEVRESMHNYMVRLNDLLAAYITGNNRRWEKCEQWMKAIKEDSESFMAALRLAFKASYPNFIKHFEESGLTPKEVEYVCLYAIGLNGVEVGRFIRKPGHVNTSSAIRKKLGLSSHETNLGIYVHDCLEKLRF